MSPECTLRQWFWRRSKLREADAHSVPLRCSRASLLANSLSLSLSLSCLLLPSFPPSPPQSGGTLAPASRLPPVTGPPADSGLSCQCQQQSPHTEVPRSPVTACRTVERRRRDPLSQALAVVQARSHDARLCHNSTYVDVGQ